MEITDDFKLNNVFDENAKIYQTKPLRATKYKEGMENAWMLYFSNVNLYKNKHSYEGVKFFATKEETKEYMESHKTQPANIDGTIVECNIEYELFVPVLVRKSIDKKDKIGLTIGDYTFESNENDKFDYFILDENSWIIQEHDGSVRVWEKENLDIGINFYGSEDVICEKVVKNGKEEYIEVPI